MMKGVGSRTARWYITFVIVAGFSALVPSLVQAIRHPDPYWAVLGVLTVLASFFPVYMPRLKGKDRGVILTISSIFVFTAMLVYGPAVATVLSALEGSVTLIKSRSTFKNLYKVLFNLAHLPLSTFLVAHLFYAMYSDVVPLDPAAPQNLTTLFLSLGIASFFFFLLNAGGIALAIALVTGFSLRQTWQQSFRSAALTNLAEASAAVVVFLNYQQTSLLALGIAMPTAVVIYYAYKMNLARIHEAQSHVDEVNDLYHATIEALALAVDAKDQVTHGHIYRVQAMAVGLARYSGMNNENDLNGLKAASLLHDIGKLATPDYILNKPGPLTDAEMETMKTHASVGAGILSSIPFPYPVVPFVLYHHEKWDGSGYPKGLKGTEIPLGARILSIIDCYDALRSDRPYRASLSREAALDYILSEGGKSYDPAIVERFVEHIDELEEQALVVASQMPQSEAREALAWEPPGKRAAGIANTVFHDIASAHREVQALHEISQAVGRLLNVSETLSLLADKMGDLVPHDACAIYLMDSNNQALTAYHACGRAGERMSGLRVRVGEGVAGWVAANHRSLVNVSPAPDFRDHGDLRSEFSSCMAVPLILDKNVVGVISLYGTESNSFRPNHLRLMENVAPHAATAISNAVIYDETKEDAYTDLLTGLPNLRYFDVFVEQELKRARHSAYPVTIVMMDLDHFKAINDTLGHKTGDRVLIEISHVLRNQMRKSDTCVRYGGDEFIGVLPGADQAASRVVMKKIQDAIDNHEIQLGDGRQVQVGISLGAAVFPQDGQRLEELIVAADQRMYQNKTERSQRSHGSRRFLELVRAESA